MKRVLFVDDDRLVLFSIERTLSIRDYGWEAAFASSGEEALERLAEAEFSVLVSDLWMPGLSGEALLKAARERYPQLRSIALSGSGSVAEKEDALCIANRFLEKPCRPAALFAAIEEELLAPS